MKKNQYGKSLVEMIGVLAIIGVLSAAGIYGYNYAIKKHKINKFINQINLIENNTRNAFFAFKDFNQLQTNDIAINLGLYPTEMLEKNPSIPYHIFNGQVTTRQGSRGPHYFTIEIKNIPKSACLAYIKSGIAPRIELLYSSATGSATTVVNELLCSKEINEVHFGFKK